MNDNPAEKDPQAEAGGFEEQPRPESEGPGDGWQSTGGTARMTMESVRGALCDLQRQVEDGVMTLVPPQVTRHLVEAHKEVVRASQRLGDIALEKLEKKAARAEELHRHE